MQFANVCKKAFFSILGGILLALGAFGQQITTTTPIRNIPFDRALPLQTWKCSGPQATLGTHMLDFLDTNGTPNGYVDCHGNIHGGSGGAVMGSGTAHTLTGWIGPNTIETMPGSQFDDNGNVLLYATAPPTFLPAACADLNDNFCVTGPNGIGWATADESSSLAIYPSGIFYLSASGGPVVFINSTLEAQGQITVDPVPDPPAGPVLADIPTGGTLNANTQYCYLFSLTQFGSDETGPSPPSCITTANDASNTHEISITASGPDGYTVFPFGRTSGSETNLFSAFNCTISPPPNSCTMIDDGTGTPDGRPPQPYSNSGVFFISNDSEGEILSDQGYFRSADGSDTTIIGYGAPSEVTDNEAGWFIVLPTEGLAASINAGFDGTGQYANLSLGTLAASFELRAPVSYSANVYLNVPPADATIAGQPWASDATGNTYFNPITVYSSAADPGCTTTADVGKTWYNTTTTTTVLNGCVDVAGTVEWGVIAHIP